MRYTKADDVLLQRATKHHYTVCFRLLYGSTQTALASTDPLSCCARDRSRCLKLHGLVYQLVVERTVLTNTQQS